MPSHNIDSCARVNDTVPLVACGHTKRPRSRRFWNRHIPSPSCQINLTKSPLRPAEDEHLARQRTLLESALHQAAQASQTPGAYPSLRQPARSACWSGSSAQTLKNGTNDLGIESTFKTDQRTARNLDVHRYYSSSVLTLFRLNRRRLALPDGNRQQADGRQLFALIDAAQLPRMIKLPPIEHLVRVHPMLPRHRCDRLARRQRLLDDPPLLFGSPIPPAPSGPPRTSPSSTIQAPPDLAAITSQA